MSQKIGLHKLLKETQIVIPIMQRDYAQGRRIGKVPLVRQRFLDAIFKALQKDAEALELDFIYGYRKKDGPIDEHERFMPLDGQQRLTTLFLLHWYVAVRENRHSEASEVLSRFTYETRHSTRVFCNKLSNYRPDAFDSPIDATIRNESWFAAGWRHDPSIDSMLTMLVDIERKYNDTRTEGAWELLTGDPSRIVFNVLPMNKLGLPDELYIKMNARGKELTEFEYFKCEFGEVLPPSLSGTFAEKIDGEWYDFFWKLYRDDLPLDKAQLADAGFLRFYCYLADVIAQRTGFSKDGLTDLERNRGLFSIDANAEFLFDCITVVCGCPQLFWSDHFYIEPAEYETGKVRLFFASPRCDLVKKCADCYDPTAHTNPFSIGEQLLLFACLLNLLRPRDDFACLLRTLRNLINNSQDRVRKENMASLLAAVEDLMDGASPDKLSAFNAAQAEEEGQKLKFMDSCRDMRECVCRLEDHHLIQGCLATFTLDNDLQSQAGAFEALFHKGCNYASIGKAMLCIGDYSQQIKNFRRMGTTRELDWKEIVTLSGQRKKFANTATVLRALLQERDVVPAWTPDAKVSAYLADFDVDLCKPKDWCYYYIKYPEFSAECWDGFCYWPNMGKQYECIKMRKTTFRGFHWSAFLYVIHDRMRQRFGDQLELSPSDVPLKLVRSDGILKMYNRNCGYKIEPLSEADQWLVEKARANGLIDQDNLHPVLQNENGDDVEDRVEKGIRLVESLFGLCCKL